MYPHFLTTTILIKEYGTVDKNVCCCCGKKNLYAIDYPGDTTILLCSWCDLHPDDRWMR